MSGVAVPYGGCEYWDRTGSLMDGSIRPAGIDLNYIVVTLYDLFRRVAVFRELGTLLDGPVNVSRVLGMDEPTAVSWNGFTGLD